MENLFLTAVPSALTSVVVLGTLALILLASVAVYWVLVERWTSRRQWVALSEWAHDESFRFSPHRGDPPEPFDALPGPPLPVRLWLVDAGASTAIVQLGTWNVLIHRLNVDWKPTGLKPAQFPASVLDLFSLTSFPLLGSSERFIVFGVDPAAARSLSRSSARALLPPDVGLLLHGRHLILDFSSRPFDAITLNRIRAVADQVAAHLPAGST